MVGDPKRIKELVESFDWKFSCIDGDPDLGNGVKCYGTIQRNIVKYDLEEIIQIVKLTAKALRDTNIKVLREKVELILYDKRYK